MKKTLRHIILAIVALGLTPNLALALPTPNQQGDYTDTRRGNRQINWQVVDSDPKGLNCRLSSKYLPQNKSDNVIDRLLEVNYRVDIPKWQVVASYRQGQRLKAETGNMAQQIIIFDSRNKPWLPIMMNQPEVNQGAAPKYCLIRANRQFIRPIAEDPISGRPLN
jgi:hypothetical protein